METFKFMDTPFWRPDYGDPISSYLKSIPEYYERVKMFIKDPNNSGYVRGFCNYYHLIYLTECNHGENTATQTMKETEHALTAECDESKCIKTRNLSAAIDYLFGNSLLVEKVQHDFSPELALKLNHIIGDGLFDGGTYRTTHAKPAGCNYIYLAPHLIKKQMDDLFNEIKKTKITSENWYESAAYFFVKFLFIHPYVNGNGRTARLPISVLLMKYSLVPVPLFASSYNRTDSNEVYLKCIIEADRYKNYLPLNSLIIESTYNTLFNFIQTFTVE